jgi:hypothetical protein
MRMMHNVPECGCSACITAFAKSPLTGVEKLCMLAGCLGGRRLKVDVRVLGWRK